MGIAQRKNFKPKGGLGARNKAKQHVSTSNRLSGSTRDHMAQLKPLVLAEANFTCVKCFRSKAEYPDLILTCDHIVPLARGGRTNKANLQCICIDCHINKPGKTNRRGAKLLKGVKRKMEKNR